MQKTKEIVRVRAPYVLEVGQGLFNQDPFENVLPRIADKYNFRRDVAGTHLLAITEAMLDHPEQQVPRLPYYDPEKPSPHARDYYEFVHGLFRQKTSLAQAEKLTSMTSDIGNTLIEYPNWLRYLQAAKQAYVPYASDGSWVYDNHSKIGTQVAPTMYTRMEAAPSYGYWAYTEQRKKGIIQSGEKDETVHTDAQVTGLLQRYDRKQVYQEDVQLLDPEEVSMRKRLVGMREWVLVKPATEPILLESRPDLTISQYKMGYLDLLAD